MSDEATLLPCPICGRKATINSWWSSNEECGVAGVGCSRESYTNGYECARIYIMRVDEKTAREDAIRIWNTRMHGTLTVEQVRETVLKRGNVMGPRFYGDWQAIADELNAELGSGTCSPVETETLENTTVHVMECDECGGTYEHVNGDYERCPHCGRKVER